MGTIGIDLGGTPLSAGLVSQSGDITLRYTVDTDHSGADAIIEQICQLVRRIRGQSEQNTPTQVGIAIPGWVDSRRGRVVTCPNIPLQGVSLASEVSSALGCKVLLENDANCATLGEQKFGAAKDCQNLILLTLGTGLGGGAMVNGQLLSGVGSTEFGHILLVRGGLPCGCGRHGCREVYCSTTALLRMANEHSSQHHYRRAKELFAALAAGDAEAQAAFSEYLGYLADTIIDLITAFRPEKVLLGGGITGAGDALFLPLRAEVDKLCQGYIGGFDLPPILPAQNGNDAGILGAAALFF